MSSMLAFFSLLCRGRLVLSLRYRICVPALIEHFPLDSFNIFPRRNIIRSIISMGRRIIHMDGVHEQARKNEPHSRPRGRFRLCLKHNQWRIGMSRRRRRCVVLPSSPETDRSLLSRGRSIGSSKFVGVGWMRRIGGCLYRVYGGWKLSVLFELGPE